VRNHVPSFVVRKFPMSSCPYWFKMVRINSPLPIFNICRIPHVIRAFEYFENTEFEPGTAMYDYINREACKVTFQRIHFIDKRNGKPFDSVTVTV
jgi:hypothetical protein